MMKVNWRLLGKSLIACVVGSFLGTPFFLACFAVSRALSDLAAGHLESDRVFELILDFFHSPEQLGFMVGFAFICLVILALPAQAVLQYFKRTSYLSNIIFAAIGGVVVEGTAVYAMGHFFTVLSDPIVALSGVWAAICTSSIAWLIRRPDRDVKQETPPPTR